MSRESFARVLRLTRLNATPAPYLPILTLQEHLFEQRKQGLIKDIWLMLQHSPTYTIGKRGSEADFHQGIQEAVNAGAQVYNIPRGGETTFHGPGQLVVYPIVDLRSLKMGPRVFVETLEDIMIDTVGRWGISAKGRFKGRTGVWVGNRKIGAIGVRISSGITCHGIALNVNPDLTYFDRIVPCGQVDKEVTSIQRELQLGESSNTSPDVGVVAEALIDSILERFGYSKNGLDIDWQPDVGQLAKMYVT